jgi:hypothetical protein
VPEDQPAWPPEPPAPEPPAAAWSSRTTASGAVAVWSAMAGTRGEGEVSGCLAAGRPVTVSDGGLVGFPTRGEHQLNQRDDRSGLAS